MKSLFAFLLASAFAIPVFAQSDPIMGPHKVRGVVTDTSGAVFSSANLIVQKGTDSRVFVTDVNGDFEMSLQPGDYQITVSETNSVNFRAFVRIVNGNLNPDNLMFVLDPTAACCASSGKPFPKPVVLPRPPYPPAARAVRAAGEVVVSMTIGTDGNVIEVNEVSGHPLLRSAAAKAARGSRFEPSTDDNRKLKLTYVFHRDSEERADLKRYSNLFRINVVSIVEISY